jgi:hypothetical protein
MTPNFALRFPAPDLCEVAARYSYPADDQHHAIVNRTRASGYLTKSDLLELGHWKAPRIGPKLARNTETLVNEATRVALSCQSEELRICALTTIFGVGWPMASVILHFCHTLPFPILDFRALWSLSVPKPSIYSYKFWWAYTVFCRNLAKTHGISMRVLDRALWQYSKENQPSNEVAENS